MHYETIFTFLIDIAILIYFMFGQDKHGIKHTISYREGYKAYVEGKPSDDNPYKFCAAHWWSQGWKDAERLISK